MIDDISESVTEIVHKNIQVRLLFEDTIHTCTNNGYIFQTEELDHIAKVCLEYISQVDSHKTGTLFTHFLPKQIIKTIHYFISFFRSIGSVNPSYIRTKLHSLSSSHTLTTTEINLIIATLPRDHSGKCIYSSFRDVLFEIKFICMKNMYMESQGTELQKTLIELCRQVEMRYLDVALLDSYRMGTGSIPLKMLMASLMTSTQLHLSRLQILMICSGNSSSLFLPSFLSFLLFFFPRFMNYFHEIEASVSEGLVNFYQFVPMAVKMIELMFDPESLKTRAQLIANTDFSPTVINYLDKLLYFVHFFD